MINPQKNFKESQYAKGWLDVVDSNAFQTAATAALTEMAMRNGSPPDMATAASFAWRMEGAKQFLNILMGLTESQPERRLPSAANLNHKT